MSIRTAISERSSDAAHLHMARIDYCLENNRASLARFLIGESAGDHPSNDNSFEGLFNLLGIEPPDPAEIHASGDTCEIEGIPSRAFEYGDHSEVIVRVHDADVAKERRAYAVTVEVRPKSLNSKKA